MTILSATWSKIQRPGLCTRFLVMLLSGCLATDAWGADKSMNKSASRSKSPTKAKPDSTATDADDAGAGADGGFEVDEDLSALVVPADVLGTIKKTDQLQFSQALRGLVLEGMTADGAAASKRHFEASHQSVPADPRAAYAYGVALLVQKNPKEALSQFRTAARQTKAPYLPALQALAWVHLQRNEYSQGLPALVDLARKIDESKGDWPTEHDKNHSSEWIGRVMGYLAGPGKSGPGKSADHAAQIEEAAATIEKTLSGDRKSAYEHGRKAITRRHDELKALAARPVDEVIGEARQIREETLAAAQKAAATVKQIEEEIRTIKKPIDQQIADADREIRSHGTKAKKLAHEVPDAQDAVEVLSQPQQSVKAVRPSRTRPQGIMAQPETAAQKKARETNLAAAKQHLQQLQTSIDNARQGATDARSQREKAKADLRKALAEKRIELVDAQHKSQELAARAKDAEHALLTPEKLKSRVTALETYVPLDPETEKTRLLATLKSPKSN